MPSLSRRPETVWQFLLAGVVGVPTVIAVLDGFHTAGQRWTVVGLALGLLAWHSLFFIRPWRRIGRWALIGYWVGVTAFVTVLAGYNSSFVIILYGICPLAFVTLSWWGMVPILALRTLVTWRIGTWSNSYGWISLVATASIALVVAVVVRATERQSEKRQAALEALAATRAELAETSHRAGMLEERQRLSRELHDTVAQGFTSIVTHLEAAEQAMPEDAAIPHRHLDIARRTARDSLGELRRTVHALRPDLLEGATLAQALRRTAQRWSTENTTPAQVRVTGDPVELHPDTEMALLRTAQEALTNIARHARASRVVVTLSYLGDAVTLDIDDDGTGFLPAAVRSDGLGLIGMRERITAIGGQLDIETTPGEGTTIAASVPA
ncbi:MAG TPA: sensor histidine kinase [Pseudonocardiaceae bacterium]|jgi:signal transduction histidine kinase|nr:sensor histidine kinase [Pseudonocardiaceae bacterium]